MTAQPVGSVKSADGTAISYIRTGNGPPLVMVPSVSADHTTFGFVAPVLAEHFTLNMIDRRGRGASGDAPDWSIEREYQDVVAVIDSIPGPVSLLGYSWSVILCLEAALLTSNIAKLVLYEPGFQAAYDPYPDGWIEKAEALLEAGDREGVVLALVRLAGLSAEEIATMRAGPSWAARVEIAHTIPRECRHDATYAFEPERFAALRIATLLLVGTATPEIYRRSVSDVHAALPDSRVVTLEGLGHGAHHAAPDRLAAEVVRFLV